MPTYEFWYDETYTYKAWFTADNLDEAYDLIAKAEQGEIDLSELPDFQSKDKNYTLEIASLVKEEEN